MRHLTRSLVLSLVLTAAVAAHAGDTKQEAPAEGVTIVAPDKAELGYSYPLATCPVSGKPYAEKAMAKSYEGREVRFCCDMCPATFEADLAANLAKADAEILAAAKESRPLPSCAVCGMGFGELSHPTHRFVLNNRVVEVCSTVCEPAFKADAPIYLAKLDTALIAQQLPGYPMTTCPVSGDPLGTPEMGPPVDFLYNGRLVRLCCAGCIRGIRTQPAEFLATLDAAYAAKGTGGA